MRAIPAHIAATSAIACRNDGDPLRMSGITATHETYTNPPAVAASSGCSSPAYWVAKRPIAVPAKAAVAVANCAPIACHFLRDGPAQVDENNENGNHDIGGLEHLHIIKLGPIPWIGENLYKAGQSPLAIHRSTS